MGKENPIGDLTLESPFRKVFAVAERLFTPEDFQQFWQEEGNQCKCGFVDYERLRDLLKSSIVRRYLKRQWQYETNPEWWWSRGLILALSETMGHALAGVMNDAFYLTRHKGIEDKRIKNRLSGVRPEKLQEIKNEASLLGAFFLWKLGSLIPPEE